MKHSIEINQSDTGSVYITIYEVIYRDDNGVHHVYQRYMSEERAEETSKMLHEFEEEKYHTAFVYPQLVFL